MQQVHVHSVINCKYWKILTPRKLPAIRYHVTTILVNHVRYFDDKYIEVNFVVCMDLRMYRSLCRR